MCDNLEHTKRTMFLTVENTVSIALLAPGTFPDNPQGIEVDLEDVRATDSILVSYDYERNGWCVSQKNQEANWVEVGFHKAYSPQED